MRIKALLKRENTPKTNEIKIGNYLFSPKKQSLIYKEIKVKLTARESDLLFHLYQQKNEVLDRSFILKKLWGNDDFFNARSMDVFISKLRKKLKNDTQVQIINVRGYGYKLVC